MRALIYKELKLALHPTVFIFLSFGAMLLIPNYPYAVPFFYTTLSIYFMFLSGRENKDVLFTALLPVRKRDCVKARIITVSAIEAAMLLISIPFAVLRYYLYDFKNDGGLEANVALFGLMLILFSIFNAIFIPAFYKTAYKCGKFFMISSFVIFILIAAGEIAIHIPPLDTYLDTSDPGMMVKQIPVLAAGIVIYTVSILLVYRRSAENFEKVDL